MTMPTMPTFPLQVWENRDGPGGAVNTNRSLTHSSGTSREGLGMKPTHLDVTTDYTVAESGCWEWRHRVDRNGYAKAFDATRPPGRRLDWAHRVSYRRHVGDIPAGHELDHTCENTICINPQHLEPVTKPEHARRTMARLGKDRLQQAAAQLRSIGLTYGEIAETLRFAGAQGAFGAVQAAIRKGLVDPDTVPPVQRLDAADRADIAALYALGVPQTEIATWYRTDRSNVSRICSGRPVRTA